jgi:nucleotide sugar dehydrogenase
VQDAHKYIFLVEDGNIEPIILQKVRPMYQVTSLKELDAIPSNAMVRILINDFEQFKKEVLHDTTSLMKESIEDKARRADAVYVESLQVREISEDKEVVLVDTLEVAEIAKLLENSFRLINISFINELAMFCSKFGVDINEIIEAASTKPYGFMPFYPSIGVGGHCIPVDPIYLATKAKEIGSPTDFIDLASRVNLGMPGYFVGRAEEIVGNLKNKRVLVVGVSYKPNVADVRETPVKDLIKRLVEKGAKVSWHDELVKKWEGSESVALSSDYDLVILATPHSGVDLSILGKTPILNTRSSI